MPDVDYGDDDMMAKIVGQWTNTICCKLMKMHDESEWAKVDAKVQISARGIEVGHIFYFGTKYSDAMKRPKLWALTVKKVAVHMGSYGIGPFTPCSGPLLEGVPMTTMVSSGQRLYRPFDIGIINMKTW